MPSTSSSNVASSLTDNLHIGFRSRVMFKLCLIQVELENVALY